MQNRIEISKTGDNIKPKRFLFVLFCVLIFMICISNRSLVSRNKIVWPFYMKRLYNYEKGIMASNKSIFVIRRITNEEISVLKIKRVIFHLTFS